MPSNRLATLSLKSEQHLYTERIAYSLYQNRLLLKRSGDAQSDWRTATRIIKSPWRKTLFATHCFLIRLEKQIWEPILDWASNQALLGLLGLVGNVGIIVVVITYIGSEKQRRDAEVLNTWQTITSAHGQSGSGGRIQALEFLNASPGAHWRRKFPWFCSPLPLCKWPKESLSGVNLSPDLDHKRVSAPQSGLHAEEPSRVYLRTIQLPNADLRSANLENADLRSANLKNADLALVNLKNADLRSANLDNTYLRSANLANANLGSVSLSRAIFLATDLRTVTNLTQVQLEGDAPPFLCNVLLPENLNVEVAKDRDCRELVTIFHAKFPTFQNLDEAEKFIERQRLKPWN